MREAVIVSSVRTAVGKAFKGALRAARPDDLAATVMREAIARVPGLDPKEIEDVILGCAMPEAEQGMNVARIASIRAGLPVEASAMTINRFCSSGLQSIAIAAQRIMAGQGEVILAGGVESMSLIPMGGNKISPNPWLMDHYPDTYLGMGLTAENLVEEIRHQPRGRRTNFLFRVIRRRLPQLRRENSRTKSCPSKWISRHSIIPMAGGQKQRKRFSTRTKVLAPIRHVEALAKLKPAFHAKGVVTAGNSSQMSDGAAAAVVMSAERARSLGAKPLARFISFATAGCPPEEMGVGPVFAIPKALKLAGLTLDKIDVIELNEAFAAQALTVIKLAKLDPARVNLNGGAVALGHPLGCTGAKLTATILRELTRRNGRYGLVTMCVGGGMGAAGIFERVS